MNYLLITFLTLFGGLIHAQCASLSESQCNFNLECEWIDNVVYGNCSSMNGMGECNATPGCNYSTLTYTCGGGTYIISDNSYCQDTPEAECSDMNQNNCEHDNSCNWVEDIQAGYCWNHNSSASCPNYPTCSWSCDGCWYLGECCGSYVCSGGYYEIDNSYCEEDASFELECTQMNESQCQSDSGCNWVENLEYESCSDLSYSLCSTNSNCNWTSQACNWSGSQECESYPGCSYSYLTYSCSGTTSYCSGGTYQVENHYCEELTVILGDINEDGILNVVDVILIVDVILTDQYNQNSDYNQDGFVNVIDIIELVEMIIGGV